MAALQRFVPPPPSACLPPRACVRAQLDLLVLMIRKLYGFVSGEVVEDNSDSLMNQEMLLPGHLYLMFLKEKLQVRAPCSSGCGGDLPVCVSECTTRVCACVPVAPGHGGWLWPACFVPGELPVSRGAVVRPTSVAVLHCASRHRSLHMFHRMPPLPPAHGVSPLLLSLGVRTMAWGPCRSTWWASRQGCVGRCA